MTARYIAQAADRCGVFYQSAESPTIQPAIDAAIAAQAKRPKAMVDVLNLDEVDLGRADGLTEDERETVEVSLHLANARHVLYTSADHRAVTCDIAELIRRIDDDHAEPLCALAVGEEHEIPQVGAPTWFVKRVS